MIRITEVLGQRNDIGIPRRAYSKTVPYFKNLLKKAGMYPIRASNIYDAREIVFNFIKETSPDDIVEYNLLSDTQKLKVIRNS